MLAGIAFASMFGAALDGDAKRWRLLADVRDPFPSAHLCRVVNAVTWL